MARHATIIGSVQDLDGAPWDVREIRPTAHGFDLYIGWPAGQRGPGHGGPRAIPTRELYEYWDARRLERDGSIYDLPLGHSAIKRLRALLGLNLYRESEQWWLDRLDDLLALTGAEFARRHGVHQTSVSVAHAAIFGKRLRAPGWWRNPPARGLLAGNLPRAYVADRLGISIGSVGRLRWILRREVAEK
jgi:hypothetical protein